MTETSPRRAVPTRPQGPRRLGTVWASIRAVFGALLGLAPHVLHHVGILAGAALLSGVFGNALLYGVGLLLSIPLLNRLRKRFHTWRAPALGVGVFTAMFLVSALVVGPAFNPSRTPPVVESPLVTASATGDHASHHGG